MGKRPPGSAPGLLASLPSSLLAALVNAGKAGQFRVQRLVSTVTQKLILINHNLVRKVMQEVFASCGDILGAHVLQQSCFLGQLQNTSMVLDELPNKKDTLAVSGVFVATRHRPLHPIPSSQPRAVRPPRPLHTSPYPS